MGKYYDFDKAKELRGFIYKHNLESKLQDFHSYDDIKEMIVGEIQKDNMYVAAHIMGAVSDLHDVADFFSYDRCMGTLEEVVPIYDIEDLFDVFGEQLEDLGVGNLCEAVELDKMSLDSKIAEAIDLRGDQLKGPTGRNEVLPDGR